MVCALTFADPARLWWLAVLPLLWLLAIPPRPRRVEWTPHFAQWEAAQAALRRRPKRLSGLRLALLLVACAAVAGAAAGPSLDGGPGPARLVVLLDGSASMAKRRPDGATAFIAARAALAAGFERVPAHVDVTVLRCGGPLVRRHGASARTLQDFGSPGGSLGTDLAALAADLARDSGTAVWTLTDGQGDAIPPTMGALTFVGGRAANGAIAGVRVDDRWPLPGLSFAVEVIAFADAPCDAVLRATGAIATPVARTLRLEPGVAAAVVIDVERAPAGGPLELQLAVPGDVLPDDDVFRADLPPLPAPRIAVLADAESGPFVHVAAAALAAEVAGTVVAADAGVPVGLVIVDGGRAAIAPGRDRALCFGTRCSDADPGVPWLEPRVADWDRADPLTAGLDLSELTVSAALPGLLPSGQALVWADDGKGGRVPLAVVAGDRRSASVHFAFRLQDSNLALLPAFPQLLRRGFVRAYGDAARIDVRSPAAAAGEQDLRLVHAAADRPLPEFAAPPRQLAAVCVLVGLIALALRAFVR